MVAALFVQETGCYVGLPDVDPWPASRDARLYAGPHPVVAHPPCARWCRLAGQVEARGGKRRGDDDGCFASALASVRKWGGLLEHPEASAAWDAFGLPVPLRNGGWVRDLFSDGWSCCVEQGHYGHKARKPTWLYAVTPALPELRWGEARRGPVARARTGIVQAMSKRQRAATPIPFRDLLLSIARTVYTRKAA